MMAGDGRRNLAIYVHSPGRIMNVYDCLSDETPDRIPGRTLIDGRRTLNIDSHDDAIVAPPRSNVSPSHYSS